MVWLFYVEYFRSLIKKKEYAEEKEIRFIVSDNYSLFLRICSIVSHWGVFKTDDKKALSETFNNEYVKRKYAVRSQMNFESSAGAKFIKIPLYEILESVEIGSNSKLTTDEIVELSSGKIVIQYKDTVLYVVS